MTERSKRNFSLLFALMLCAVFVCGCGEKAAVYSDDGIVGVWWWSDSLGDGYLDFAADNSVTEIYYCSSKFNAETDAFIEKAAEKNIDVYWLTGEYQWVENSAPLITRIERYLAYQAEYEHVFKGIHFDIEPHQHKEFSSRRSELITKFVELTATLRQSYPELWLEYDIPFWLNDAVTVGGVEKAAYRHVIDNASRVTVMSYRDTAESIYSVAEDEVEYAVRTGKPINLGVETKSSEGDKVSFMEEGKRYMYGELAALREMLPSGSGIVIHQIKQWYDLFD